jgi:hypothetical protein
MGEYDHRDSRSLAPDDWRVLYVVKWRVKGGEWQELELRSRSACDERAYKLGQDSTVVDLIADGVVLVKDGKR